MGFAILIVVIALVVYAGTTLTEMEKNLRQLRAQDDELRDLEAAHRDAVYGARK